MRLGSKTDGTVIRFAEKWGPLGVCRHGKPAAHAGCDPLSDEHRGWETRPEQVAWSARLAAVGGGDRSPGLGPWWDAGWEPLTAWRFYARVFRATLEIAINLRQGRPTRAEDWLSAILEPSLGVSEEWDPDAWKEIGDPAAWEPGDDARERARELNALAPAVKRENLAFLVSAHLEDTAVVPRMRWGEGAPEMTFSLGAAPSPGLLAVLSCQLAATIASDPGVRRCSVCLGPYVLPPEKRTPRHDKREFCGDECRTKAKAAADHAYNASDKGRAKARERKSTVQP